MAVGGDGPLVHVFTAGTDRAAQGGPGARAGARRVRCRPPRRRRPRRRRPARRRALGHRGPGLGHRPLLGDARPARHRTPRPAHPRRRSRPLPAWRLLDRYRVTHLHAGPAHFRAMAAAGPAAARPRRCATRRPPASRCRPDLVTWAEEVLGHPAARPVRAGRARHRCSSTTPAAAPGDHSAGRCPAGASPCSADDRDEPAPPRRRRPARRRPGGQPADVVRRLRRRRRRGRRGAVHPGTAAGTSPATRPAWTPPDATVSPPATGDVIVTAGHRIAPFEVESVLMLHEDVAEAVVVGVPTTRRGTVPEAYVGAARRARSPRSGSAEDLKQMVRTKLAGLRGAERGARRRRAAAHSRGHGAAGCAARAAGTVHLRLAGLARLRSTRS